MLRDIANMPNLADNEIDVVSQVLQQLKKKVQLLSKKNKELRATIKKHTQFKKDIGKTFHDLQSPLLSIDVIASANELPENKRVALKSAAISAIDITSEALTQFGKRKTHLPENSKRQPVLVSAILSEIIEDRKLKYAKFPIQFEYDFNRLNAFLFIKIAPSDFKRTISNLINNAIDSLPEAHGTIKVKLKANEKSVFIDIWDDGIGIPDKILQKLNKGTKVTHGKGQKGHGLGMAHVHDTLNKNHGEMSIVSSTQPKNHGTTILLTFPRVSSPHWISNEISFTKNNTIIILDDNKLNLTPWEHKFAQILQKLPNIKVKYFTSGVKVINYVNDLCVGEKEDICLFCDYELINQELSGLEVIKECGIKHSYLIINHFVESAIKNQAAQGCTKMIIKELIPQTPCKIIQDEINNELVNVHMVWVDDEQIVAQTLIAEYYHNLIVDTYSNPFEFLNDVAKYPKDTRIILDNYYYAPDGSTYAIDGITLAEKLHAQGFTNLVLLSGEVFNVPGYLQLILKSDKSKIANLYESTKI